MKFNIGDACKLKHGSPLLTVESFLAFYETDPTDTGNIEVVWFNNGVMYRATIHEDLLIPWGNP